MGLEGVMLQQGARGTVRLGKEVCVHIPGFPTAAAGEGGAGQHQKRGEMNGETAREEAAETGTRDTFPLPNLSLFQLNVQLAEIKRVGEAWKRNYTYETCLANTSSQGPLCSQASDWMRMSDSR